MCALALLLPCVALGAPNAADLQKKARARMKSLDFEAALPLLEQLRELPGLDAPVRAAALVDLGITFVNLGRSDDARKAFDEALEASPEVPFPSSAPPKIRRLFDDAKEARLARLNPPPVAVVEPVAPPVKLEPAPAAPAVVVLAPPPPSERMVVLPVTLLVAGAGAIAAGVGTALGSQGADRQLSSALHTSAEAQALRDQRSSLGVASYVCYGAGAAMMVAGAALFAFTGSSAKVSAVITPNAGALMVGGEF